VASRIELRTIYGVSSVIITGSSGAIGSSTVLAFRAAGLAVVGIDKVAPLPGAEPDAHVTGDVGEAGALAEAVKAAAEIGELHHVVHIAGGALLGEVEATDPTKISIETFQASIELNLVSAWAVVQAVTPALRLSTGNRSITMCSSRNALSGHGIAPYSAAKAGLMGMIHPLAVQLGSHGIRINAVAPGQIATPYAQQVHASMPGHFERIAAKSALGRLAVESEVAQAFTAMALTLTATTGHLLVVDAGGEVWR
jgi:NAD(P)-dependent dehydrogenase (short-subunit alcohol dehydrogenase family)